MVDNTVKTLYAILATIPEESMNKQEIHVYEFLKKLQKMFDDEYFLQNDFELSSFTIDFKGLGNCVDAQLEELKDAIGNRAIKEWEEKKESISGK